LSTLNPTYPGIYVNEVPSSVHSIIGVQTAVAAFVGYAAKGPLDQAVNVGSWLEYQQSFGGIDPNAAMSYAVYLFFLNGGGTAEIVRAGAGAAAGAVQPVGALIGLSADLQLAATSPGTWANALQASVDTNNLRDPSLYNLTVTDTGASPAVSEFYPALGTGPGQKSVVSALASSALVRAVGAATAAPAPGVYSPNGPVAPVAAAAGAAPAAPAGGGAGTGGGGASGGGAAGKAGAGGAMASAPGTDIAPAAINILGDGATTGIYALIKADIFNMLALPVDVGATYPSATLATAAAFCKQHRAILLVDPPSTWTNVPLDFATVTGSATEAVTGDIENAAVYYPNLKILDPLTNAPTVLGPCGAVAGAWAATDQSRGVWKAPAGTQVALSGLSDLSVKVDDHESGVLNPLAVNCLRTFPLLGPVVWGARTAAGFDENTSQWKYIPIRRTALFIEESLYRGTRWVVFEPNDEPLWAAIRLNVGSFMNTLFGQGAFQGSTPAQAYLVKCDADNNPQATIDQGIVNILVGFAPLYPAEFVFINIEQLTNQSSV
jgi:phage tail sheath protein FI